jgi:hypothetical protein
MNELDTKEAQMDTKEAFDVLRDNSLHITAPIKGSDYASSNPIVSFNLSTDDSKEKVSNMNRKKKVMKNSKTLSDSKSDIINTNNNNSKNNTRDKVKSFTRISKPTNKVMDSKSTSSLFKSALIPLRMTVENKSPSSTFRSKKVSSAKKPQESSLEESSVPSCKALNPLSIDNAPITADNDRKNENIIIKAISSPGSLDEAQSTEANIQSPLIDDHDDKLCMQAFSIVLENEISSTSDDDSLISDNPKSLLSSDAEFDNISNITNASELVMVVKKSRSLNSIRESYDKDSTKLNELASYDNSISSNSLKYRMPTINENRDEARKRMLNAMSIKELRSLYTDRLRRVPGPSLGKVTLVKDLLAIDDGHRRRFSSSY